MTPVRAPALLQVSPSPAKASAGPSQPRPRREQLPPPASHSSARAHGNVPLCCQLSCVQAQLGSFFSFQPVKLQQLGTCPANSEIPGSKLTGPEAAARQSLACKLRGEKAWHSEKPWGSSAQPWGSRENTCDCCEPGLLGSLGTFSAADFSAAQLTGR